MEVDTPPVLDPYEFRPFQGYPCGKGLQVETYLSLMHFIEAEKFRGIDEGYRKYLLSINDRDDFILETAGITQGVRRDDWDEIKGPMARAGLWMQLVQHKDALAPIITHPECNSDIRLVETAIQEICSRLYSGDPLRKVLIVGDESAEACSPNSFRGVLDHIFGARRPDEVIVSSGPGIAALSAEYAAQNYIPLRTIPCVDSEAEFAKAATGAATHVFFLVTEGGASSFAQAAFDLACETGLVAHQVEVPA
ncbi:hypothetical protein IIE18_11020 [Pseudomonas sp. V1]|uniref:hypothetical protein n=1 Tax=Pseudomonas arcuscaelestis TaxID=2710591 RepID=UPI00193F1BC0|nr:hypothetical protein [Pseudomonas arcuscaelestis]MBM3105671.1 hypothetical protein [Pseudomonas arcuscaelestis]